MYSPKLDYLEFQLELAEQDLLDHDGSEINAQERIDTLKTQVQKLKQENVPY